MAHLFTNNILWMTYITCVICAIFYITFSLLCVCVCVCVCGVCVCVCVCVGVWCVCCVCRACVRVCVCGAPHVVYFF